MAQWVTVLADKPNDLILIPRSYKWRTNYINLSLVLRVYAMGHRQTYTVH